MITNKKTSHKLPGAWRALASVIVALGAIQSAHAFTAADVNAAWGSWKNSFYYLKNNSTEGYFNKQLSDTDNPSSFWRTAEMIEMIVDKGDSVMAGKACTGFAVLNGNGSQGWPGNAYNDDLAWASIAHIRAYQLTGTVAYKTAAKAAFDTLYSRGWDTAGGGGMWWNTSKNSKNSAAEFPASIAAYLLYQTLGDSSYLTKSQNLYNWGKNNLFDSSTGKVKDSTISTASYTYNQGTFGGAAYFNGDSANGLLSFNYVKNTYGTAMQSFGANADAGGFNGICLRWMAKKGFNTTYLQNVCNQAWGFRNSSGLTDQNWTRRSTDGADLYSWDCSSMVAGMLCVPPG
jgi:hypothetical protein